MYMYIYTYTSYAHARTYLWWRRRRRPALHIRGWPRMHGRRVDHWDHLLRAHSPHPRIFRFCIIFHGGGLHVRGVHLWGGHLWHLLLKERAR